MTFIFNIYIKISIQIIITTIIITFIIIDILEIIIVVVVIIIIDTQDFPAGSQGLPNYRLKQLPPLLL